MFGGPSRPTVTQFALVSLWAGQRSEPRRHRLGARLPIRCPRRSLEPARANVRPADLEGNRTSSRVNIPHGIERRTAGRDARRISFPCPHGLGRSTSVTTP